MATIGLDCNVTLENANVNGGKAVGFFVKPGSFTMTQPRRAQERLAAGGAISYVESGLGKREFTFVVLCRSNVRNFNGSLNATNARQWHDRLWEYFRRLNESHAFVDPLGESFTVRFAACEDRIVSYGKEQLWLLEWETRVVLREV